MIKVVHIQYQTESGANPAFRLQQEFLKADIDSSILSLKSAMPPEERRVVSLGKNDKRISGLDYKLQSYRFRNNIKKFGLFSYPILGINISTLQQIKNADYIYVHWVLNGFLSIKNIEQLAKLGKPVIFFMHDMWNITGGCHYSFACENYQNGCGDCQIFPNKKSNDLSKREFAMKAKVYSKYKNLFFIAPSRWLENCAKESLLTKEKPVYYIPNLLTRKIFKPFDKNVAKQILNIDSTDFVIAFGANAINSPYKGWPYFQKALEFLKQKSPNQEITVLIFGSGDTKLGDFIPFKTKFLGFLRDEYSASLTYNASDVFVVPSLADNQPTTVQESLSCGTAVVGFDIGGIPDMVDHKRNGYLARYKDADDIAEGIKFCLDNKIKGYRLPAFEPEVVIKQHLELYKQIKMINSQAERL